MRQGWTVTWSRPGLWSLREIHWLDGAAVDRAVQGFAATGEGDVTFARSGPPGVWLKVAPHVVRLSFDHRSRIIVVWWVCKAWW
jgi:hypothetical protein